MTTIPIAPAAEVRSRKNYRWAWWLLSLVAAFILGWLLHKCPHTSPTELGAGSASAAGGGGGGGGAGGAGGGGAGGAGGGGGGGAGALAPGGGNLAGGNGAGRRHGGGDGDGGLDVSMNAKTDAGSHDVQLDDYAKKLAGGAQAGSPFDATTPPPFPTRSKSAPDFSLDGTGLPRYGNTTHVMSAVAMRTDITGDSATTAEMVTSDSFDKVASWYHDQLPADWKQARTDDLAKVAHQMSTENIGKMLHSFATGMAAGSDTSMPADTSSAPPGPSFAGFSPPDNDTHHRKTVIVMSKPGEPTTIITSRVVLP